MGDDASNPSGKGGTAADHQLEKEFPMLVGPSTEDQFNLLRFMLTPVACWRINDIRFEFDSAFVLPEAQAEFAQLKGLRNQHPDAPVSIWGHADPVGNDDFNKGLSGRRAEAVYAVLIRDPDRWVRISGQEDAGHQWTLSSTQRMLTALGEDPGDPTGKVNPQTKAAVQSFQSKNGLDPDGDPGPATRKALFGKYMDFLAGDLKLQKTDFLAQGADDKGKGDFQGCSEFNPVLVFSSDENKEFQKPANQAKRNEENSPNRRVVALLFRPGTVVPAAKWPCPRASEGITGCKARFWRNGEDRRKVQAERREFADTKNTFACRFYHRLTVSSPCESTGPITPTTLYLKLVSVDDHFAPSTENLDIQYSIIGFAGRSVKLTIEAQNYDTAVVFEHELTDDEKLDGDKTYSWDGKLTAGARNGRYATPLMGPYLVRLTGDDGTDETLPFKILYHSLALDWGKHTPDETEPADQNKLVQYKLDDLGYDGGPVDGNIGLTTNKALVRFQRANYKVGTQTLLTPSGLADADTVAALKAAAKREIFEAGKNPITDDAKFYVYDNFMNDPTMDFVTGNTPEFNSTDRKKYAEDFMDRPFLPLEVEVKLLNKANAGVSAPDAVGLAPVGWEMDDATEVDVVGGGNALAQTYTQHAREIGTSGTIAGAARIDTDGDNALDTFDGFRKAAAADYVQSMFPNDAGSKLAPYSIARYQQETRDAKDFQQAVVLAWDDPAQFPLRKGRAGVYFRFSFKGGDDGKVRAGLTFVSLPNQKYLEDSHKAAGVTLFQQTGRWTIWRRTRFSAYCAMAVPTASQRPSGQPNWGTIHDFFKQAYLDVENNGQPLNILNYSTVITDAVYRATITGLPAGHKPPGVTAANLNYSPTCLYGGPALVQANGESAQAFRTRARAAVTAWCGAGISIDTVNGIMKVVYDEARKTSPEGYVIFDFRLSDPMTARDWNPALNGGHGGFTGPANPSMVNFTTPSRGYVRCAGAVTINVDNNSEVNDYVCHEGGHARFLYHHAYTDANQSNPASANPTHHDANQLLCTMSYTPWLPGFNGTTLQKPYCGKCLLRLRGWNVLVLPQKYV